MPFQHCLDIKRNKNQIKVTESIVHLIYNRIFLSPIPFQKEKKCKNISLNKNLSDIWKYYEYLKCPLFEGIKCSINWFQFEYSKEKNPFVCFDAMFLLFRSIKSSFFIDCYIQLMDFILYFNMINYIIIWHVI